MRELIGRDRVKMVKIADRYPSLGFEYTAAAHGGFGGFCNRSMEGSCSGWRTQYLPGFFVHHYAGHVLADNVFIPSLLIRISYFPVCLFLYGIRLPETNTPIKKQPQLYPRGMGSVTCRRSKTWMCC